MRFNQWFPKTMLVGVSLLAFTASAVTAEDKKLDLTKINTILVKVLNEALKENNNQLGKFFTSAAFKVDEAGTDLSSKEQMKIKFSTRATARGAVWAPEGDTTLQLDLSATADLVKKSAQVELKSSLETDTLKLFGFAAERLAPEFCKPKKPGIPLTDLEKAMCSALTGIAHAPEMTVVFSHFVAMTNLHLENTKTELTRVEAALAAATKPEEKAYLEKRVKNAREDLAVSFFVQREFEKAYHKGKSSGKFAVKLQDLSFFASTELREFELYIDTQKLDLGLRLAQNDIKDMANYFKRRDQIEAELLKLQNSDPQSLKTVKSTIGFVLTVTKDFIGKP